MAKAAEIRGPAGDWHALRSDPGYRADWRAHGGESAVVESAGLALRAQTEADLEAARWGLPMAFGYVYRSEGICRVAGNLLH